jgi:hypothetical protein
MAAREEAVSAVSLAEKKADTSKQITIAATVNQSIMLIARQASR